VSRERFCRPPGAADTAALLRSATDPSARGWTPGEVAAEAARCLASLTCTWCEVCQLMCPDLCVTRDPDSGQIRIDLDHCKGCGLCAHFCPKGAIQMETEPADPC